MSAKQWRNASFKFQPLLYRCNLNRDSRPEARLAFCEAPASRTANLKHCRRLLFGQLGKRWIRATRQKCCKEHQRVCSHFALLAADFSAHQKRSFAEFDNHSFTGQLVGVKPGSPCLNFSCKIWPLITVSLSLFCTVSAISSRSSAS